MALTDRKMVRVFFLFCVSSVFNGWPGYNSRPHDFTISRPVAMYLLMPDVNYYLDF
jgi:hypothetical protein